MEALRSLPARLIGILNATSRRTLPSVADCGLALVTALFVMGAAARLNGTATEHPPAESSPPPPLVGAPEVKSFTRAAPRWTGAPAPQRDPGAEFGRALPALRARVARSDPGVPAAEVERWMLRLATRPADRAWMETALGRMAAYEPLVRQYLRREGAPDELLYLALIESQFKSTAVSHAGAAGMWQFMAGTGRSYDLEVSHYVDERMDPVRSSEAAVRHLRDLHREFQSWHLALAAYNAGSGRIGSALRRYAGGRRGDDLLYWQIRPHLPRETRAYVPLYLAAAEIARDANAFGLRPRRVPPLAFAEVWVPGGIPLAHVAAAHGVSAHAVEQLNPHLVRRATPPGRRWPVRVPLASTESSSRSAPLTR